MLRQFTMRSSRTASWLARAARYVRDRRGTISPILAMGLVPFIGALAIAIEGSNWWLTQRAAQNAADSAAIAGAINGTNTGVTSCLSATGDPCYEAKAVTAQYGFADGSNNVTVTPATNITCPSPLAATNCVRVIITKKLPIYLLNVVGFSGDTTIGGRYYQTISARATAYPTGGANPPFCLVALGQNGVVNDLTVNGGPNSNLNGCDVGSNGAATCNGHPIGGTVASYAASGDTNDCAANGNDQSLKAPMTDPYLSQASNLPTNPCGASASSYPQIPTSGNSKWAATANQLGPGFTGGGTQNIFCGDVQLSNTTTSLDKHGNPVTTTQCDAGTVTLAAGTVLVIENGVLDLCGATLAGTGVTIVFTGPSISGFSPNHFPTDIGVNSGGALNISAPTSGTWNGFAIYQDPNLTSGINITSAGNSPTWGVAGLVYAPHSLITISGSVGSSGSCIGILADTITINGTGNVIESSTCDPISLSGESFLSGRVALVQ
jgi:Flp pilus assembly protein TadG